ncbi:hypothetical protein EST38_g5888 [Candolleomyces aberdarensis]|uniref:Uncharacterized protein n=1 Tax=Candolleomyces aberdarensis TaxID=2316362 RepID=A0A4Q2DIZ0_9AGAR|nr:hypothetical protein EST38_g5888 [Candolleomyces aberdarensis]
MNSSKDYIQLLHNHVGGQWEELRSESPGMHTLRYLIRGEEVGRASATRKVFAKKIVAYRYLRDSRLITEKDQEMEAQL